MKDKFVQNYLRACTYTFFLFISIVSYGQTVGYTHKPLAAEGCSVKYNVVKQDTLYYIIATVSSDRLTFLQNPTMKIRSTNGDVLILNGNILGNDMNSVGVVIGNVVVTDIKSTAQFSISPSEFEQIKDGIIKVRLSMTPMDHEKNFKKDKIGKKLYEFYLNEKSKVDDF